LINLWPSFIIGAINGGGAMGRKASGKLCSDTTKCRQKNGWTYLFAREREYNPETKRYRTVRKTLVGKYPPGDPCTGPPLPTRPKRRSPSTASAQSQEAAGEGGKSNLTISMETTAMIDIIMHVAENSGVKKEINDLGPVQKQVFKLVLWNYLRRPHYPVLELLS